MSFDEFFKRATEFAEPLPYQRRLATMAGWPARIEIPTGLGKTAAVVLAWLYRRQDPALHEHTPRRLVYCLPMRVLVEQTAGLARQWLDRLELPSVRIATLMGGAVDRAWDLRPEDDAILVGTQDMLLSRALNRGYGMSCYRWPMHFGLLNNDCLWVIDEVQLVGSGVATTTQLQALRRKVGTAVPTKTTWMSATLEESWLRTVDVDDLDLDGHLELDSDDANHGIVHTRLHAAKRCSRARSEMGDARTLAAEILEAHRPGSRTIVIVNTVGRASELFDRVTSAARKQHVEAIVVLLHSRFRPEDRQRHLDALLAEPGRTGTICVSTQVIEAGVDVSAATLFTELAPWASVVQRCGRCNRQGEIADARVFWIGLPAEETSWEKLARPYPIEDLRSSAGALGGLSEASPASLPQRSMALGSGATLRRRDLLDLFDTTPDLMGNDVDVARFIREAGDLDVRVYWREFDGDPGLAHRGPAREEVCPAPVSAVRDWRGKRGMWVWDGLADRFTAIGEGAPIRPGMTILLRSYEGGYDPGRGLDPTASAPVTPVLGSAAEEEDVSDEGDPESEWSAWYTLRQHSDDVAREASTLASAVLKDSPFTAALMEAGRWHDAGKAHPVWQAGARKAGANPPDEPVAKSRTRGGPLRFERRGFRHELASALLALQNGCGDLVSFLVASHHGKVRVSLRSRPDELAPLGGDGRRDPNIRYARGVWEGDETPEIDLGAGLVVAPATLTLRYMDLGEDEQTGPSWLARVLALRDAPDLGPFRLAFLEALLKAADERASAAAKSAMGGHE